jgi:hypothetical protein
MAKRRETVECKTCGRKVALAERLSHLVGHDSRAFNLDADEVISKFSLPQGTKPRRFLVKLTGLIQAKAPTIVSARSAAEAKEKVKSKLNTIRWQYDGMHESAVIFESVEVCDDERT